MIRNEFNSYEIIKELMRECTLELILNIKKTKEFCSPMDFRIEMFDLMADKDNDLGDFFEDREWVIENTLRIVGDPVRPVYMYDGYIERIFSDMMEDFCDEHQDLIPILKEWEASGFPRFRMSDIHMEEYQTVEEYEMFLEKARSLVRKYAKMRNLSVSKIKISLPWFEDPEDLIAYLEREMELMVEDGYEK
jgi:hypothetical protein